ncbi:cytochrome c [Acetobacter fabarum]|uniref:c-type cytochrome n=1 Tax=Acetobacter fabarum TaxID=483199 RepID=UPI00312B6C08
MSVRQIALVVAYSLIMALPTYGWATTQPAVAILNPQQVAQGVVLYKQRCGACHDTPSRSLDEAPQLAGPAFARKWLTRPDALFRKIRYSMPQNNPGTLTDTEARALAAALASGQISGQAPVK